MQALYSLQRSFEIFKQGVKKKYLTPRFFYCMIHKVSRQKRYSVITDKEFLMEEKVEQAYLYDFYGELLNEHQSRIYEAFVFQDLSLGEIAKEEGISRQGVHDMIKRCNKILEGYEEKLHLVAKFLNAKKKVSRIHCLAGEFHKKKDESILTEIEDISNEILEEL